jgi:CBS domain-containing protein
MLCPDCGYDNIDGVDVCEECGQSLAGFEPGTEMEQAIARHSVSVLCPKSPVTAPPTITGRDAVARMIEHKIGCLLIASDGALEGIVTERDVLNKATPDLTALHRPVTDFMTRNPETVTIRDSIAYALHAMDLGGYRHMPVVDDRGRPTGVISIRDILRFLCVRFAELRSRGR